MFGKQVEQLWETDADKVWDEYENKPENGKDKKKQDYIEDATLEIKNPILRIFKLNNNNYTRVLNKLFFKKCVK